MREVIINGYEVSTYNLGVVSEHNSTKLVITPPKELICDDVAYYKVLFKLRNVSNPIISQPYYTYPMEVNLVQALTINTSLDICVIAYDDNNRHLGISKKIEGFYFEPSDYNIQTASHIEEYSDEPLFNI